jgi:aminoglycoside phosphotransferase (APT) family kinase protein
VPASQPAINSELVRNLVSTQFPQWGELTIRPLAVSGWDNRTFHLGEHMLVRMPSAACYKSHVEKEQYWLLKLAPLLPLAIPTPLALGEPALGYPWKWSIYSWIPGETVAASSAADLNDLATRLAQFLFALQQIDATNGPLPSSDNFYRGGSLLVYDSEVRRAITTLDGKVDVQSASAAWEDALKFSWNNPPVWFHGDISPGNLLIQNRKLNAVIDFGLMGVGDPACDLAIAWTLFKGKSREVFKATLAPDESTWSRGRAWALWKALITAAGFSDCNNTESKQCWRIIDEVLMDYRCGKSHFS